METPKPGAEIFKHKNPTTTIRQKVMAGLKLAVVKFCCKKIRKIVQSWLKSNSLMRQEIFFDFNEVDLLTTVTQSGSIRNKWGIASYL
ncbi:MAG: hypothetical protein HY080_17115 [Gammaproteobacteria bacterium]|nr:hypothetical protein [Gammaproteobacteria bacterium]